MYEHSDIIYEVDHKSKIPLYFQVETLLRKLIELPMYQSGELLPNEVEFSHRLGVSRGTTRQAINNLVIEGLIERKKGVGTKVSKNPTVSNLNDWLSFTKEMKSKGLDVINFQLNVKIINADEEIAKALGIEPRRLVVRLFRLRGTSMGPAVVTTSWFHPRLGIKVEEEFKSPLYELLDKKYNSIVHFSQEKIRAEMADKEIAQLLDIKVGSPVLSRTRIVSDKGRRPVEYNMTYYRADSFTYFIELQRH